MMGHSYNLELFEIDHHMDLLEPKYVHLFRDKKERNGRNEDKLQDSNRNGGRAKE